MIQFDASAFPLVDQEEDEKDDDGIGDVDGEEEDTPDDDKLEDDDTDQGGY